MPHLIRNTLLAAVLCTALVLLSCFYLDKPIAFWVYHQAVDHISLLKWFTYISDVFFGLVSVFYLIFIVRFSYKKLKYADYVSLTVANSIVISSFLKQQLKFVFGRYWPMTWVDNNPSLINNNEFGFNFFHHGAAYNSFPSGHTCVVIAAMTVFWMLYPRYRWFYVTVAALVIIGLIGLDYHFVSDIVAGGFLGAFVGYWVVKISSLDKKKHQLRNYES